MENHNNYQFKAITRLKLYDIKSQKKTVPYKKFCNLPLSYEEKLKENFQIARHDHHESFDSAPPLKTISQDRFRQSINKLSQPRAPPSPGVGSNQEIGNILKKCKRLMKNGHKFVSQMNRFEKTSEKCLSSIEKKMSILISDGLSANYYI